MDYTELLAHIADLKSRELTVFGQATLRERELQLEKMRNEHWFTVTLGHSCHWCHRWVRIGEKAHYQSSGDCGIVYCEPCARKVGWN